MTVTLPFVFCRLAAITVLWLALIPCIGAQTPPGGDAFLTRFRATVANPDVAALTDLTNLPFLFEGRPHERAAFVTRVVPQLFIPSVRKCLAHATAQPEDGRLVLWCKPYGFYLGISDVQWRLMAFVADGEP